MSWAGGIRQLLDDYRAFAGGRLWLALGLMLLGAFAEGFGILMLVPLAAIATGSESRFAGLTDWLPADQRFLAVLALFLAAMGARSLLLYWRERELARLQAGYEASLRLRAAATLARRGWAFAGTIGQAGMQTLLLTDVPRAALAVAHAQSFATGLILLAVQLLLALLLSPALAAIALAILVLGYGLAMRFTRRSVASGTALTERSEESSGTGFRLHAGLKAALAQGTVAQFLAEYRASLARQQDEIVRFAGDLASARQFAAFGAAVAAVLILFAGVRLLHVPFAILIPSLVLFARTVAPAQTLQQSAQYIAAYSAAFAAVVQRLGPLDEPGAGAGMAEPLEWRELRLEEASVRHASDLGLSAVSLTLRRGDWIGVSGASGAGKTTLVDLVAGLLAPTSGRVLVDGRALDPVALDGWRAGLAYVGQEGSVFDDSVRGNLLADGAEAGDAALWQALAAVGLDERVRALDGGLDERVGDRGSRLSGGERQRLAIARALLRRPTLLILDEATAALDPAGEATLLERVRALAPRPAAIIVAHRESTHAYCDSVVEVRHGVAEKSGDSSDLSG
ncbi:MAG TPA: ATP-binding cassette domain-containing protein [Sphingomicrobium sp.]|nr:ATP-binding cassette domain-containing protein [Sphingomicrobium sp.]